MRSCGTDSKRALELELALHGFRALVRKMPCKSNDTDAFGRRAHGPPFIRSTPSQCFPLYMRRVAGFRSLASRFLLIFRLERVSCLFKPRIALESGLTLICDASKCHTQCEHTHSVQRLDGRRGSSRATGRLSSPMHSRAASDMATTCYLRHHSGT